MKKLTLLLFIVCCSLQAQNGIDFGALAGLNYSHYEYTGDEDVFANYDEGIGYYFGGFISMPVFPKISFAPELLYARQTATAKGDVSFLTGGLFTSTVEADAKEDLLLLPLMFRIKLMKFDLAFGPQVGYSLSRKIDVSAEGFSMELDDEMMSDLFDYDNDTKDKISLNLNIDAGYYITKHLKAGIRYSYGLLLRDEVRVSVWQLGLSYGVL